MSKTMVILLSAAWLATETRCYLLRYLLKFHYIPSDMLSTVEAYKGELNINSMLELILLNEDELDIHLHN